MWVIDLFNYTVDAVETDGWGGLLCRHAHILERPSRVFRVRDKIPTLSNGVLPLPRDESGAFLFTCYVWECERSGNR